MRDYTPNALAQWSELLDGLRERGYCPQESHRIGEEWFDLGRHRLLMTEDEIRIVVFSQRGGVSWQAAFDGAPDSVVLAALDVITATQQEDRK